MVSDGRLTLVGFAPEELLHFLMLSAEVMRDRSALRARRHIAAMAVAAKSARKAMKLHVGRPPLLR